MFILIPLGILILGSIIAGFLFKDFLIGSNFNDFWNNSLLFIKDFNHHQIPFWLLFLTPLIVVLSIPISYFIYIKDTTFLVNLRSKNEKIYQFLLNKWYFDEIYEKIFVKPIKKIGVFLWKSGDIKIIDKFGPDGVSKIIKVISNKAVKLQSGYIFDYAFIMLIGFSLLLTFFIIYK